MYLDLVSSLNLMSILVAVMGVWMFLDSSQTKETNRRPLQVWGFGCLLFGLAFFLVAKRGDIDLIWSLVVGNFLFASGFVCFGYALALLFERPFPMAFVGIVVTGITLFLYLSEVLYQEHSWRIISLALLTLLPWWISVRLCYKQWQKTKTVQSLVMSILFFLLILVTILRLTLTAPLHGFGYTGLPTLSTMVIGNYILAVSPLLLTTGFFLLFAEKDNRTIQNLADTDPLTQIHNRRAFYIQACNQFETAKRRGGPLSCMIIDLDYFKSVNDRFGHAAGDYTLKQIAILLRTQKRGEDIVGRLGGDEFALFLPNTELDGARIFGERLKASLKDLKLFYKGHSIPVSLSIGISGFKKTDQTPEEILNRADWALYKAKEEGRDRVFVQAS